MTFPILPANSSLSGPRPPSEGPFAEVVSTIHRMAGQREPIAMAGFCGVYLASAGAGPHVKATLAQRIEMVRWLLHHANAWADLAEREARVAIQHAAE